MAWKLTAPTLPSGSSWAQAATLSYENNNLKITGTIYVARLDGKNFAVKVTETRTFYKTGFTDVYHRCDVAGVTGTTATGTWPSNSGSTVSYYFTGVAAAGASVKVVVGRKADSTDDMITKSFAAPALFDTGGGSTGGETGGGSSGGGTTPAGWSTTAPTLPSGSSWVQKGTTSWENNNIIITSKVFVARLDDDGIAIRITETRTQQGSAYSKDNYMRVDIGGTTGAAYTTDWAANSGVAKSIYYTSTAAAGETIKVVVGFRADTSDSLKTVTFAAPDLLGPTIFINVNGTARTVTAAQYNN